MPVAAFSDAQVMAIATGNVDVLGEVVSKSSKLTTSFNRLRDFSGSRVIPSMAHGYIKEENGFKEYDYLEESFFATKADGGIYTSVNEFIEWEKALRNYTLISKDLTDIAHSPKITVTDLPNTSYGYGWFIEEKPGFPQKVFHTGDNGGFQIYAARYPKQKILYLIFANRNDKNREDLADKIDQVLKKEGWLN